MTATSGSNEKLSQDKSKRYVRPISELWEMWKPRAKMRIYPFTYARYEDVERVMTNLTSYDRVSGHPLGVQQLSLTKKKLSKQKW